jgi:toxin FitB
MPFVVLDSYVLSLVSNPGRRLEIVQCQSWVRQLVGNEIPVVVPEIIDYELRRKLIKDNKEEGIQRLNTLGELGIIYDPITTRIMQKAAALWGWARKKNQQTANDERIDVDVILAAHAIVLAAMYGEYTVVATSNIKHIGRYTPAKSWTDISPKSCFEDSQKSKLYK